MSRFFETVGAGVVSLIIVGVLVLLVLMMCAMWQTGKMVGKDYRWRGERVTVVNTVRDNPGLVLVRIDRGPEARPRFEEITVNKGELKPLPEEP